MGLIDSSRTGSPMGLLGSTVSRVGQDGVASPAPDNGAGPRDAMESASLQIYPWWVYGPQGTQFFYRDSLVQTIPALTSDVSLGTDVQLSVGKGEFGVIVSIALLVQSPTATDDFFYTLKRNGGPVNGLDRLRNFPVASSFSLRELNGYVIRLEPGDNVEWSVTNNGASARDVSVSYLGWTIAQTEVQRVQRGINY